MLVRCILVAHTASSMPITRMILKFHQKTKTKHTKYGNIEAKYI